jgi:hypothetical protein
MKNYKEIFDTNKKALITQRRELRLTVYSIQQKKEI